MASMATPLTGNAFSQAFTNRNLQGFTANFLWLKLPSGRKSLSGADKGQAEQTLEQAAHVQRFLLTEGTFCSGQLARPL